MDRATGREAYRAARDVLVRHRDDYEAAVTPFCWPDVGERFNWAVDWFDPIAAGNPRTALRVIGDDGSDESVSDGVRPVGVLDELGPARGAGGEVDQHRVLSTMYFLGLRPGDVHLNISSPGWAKHAWSSFFAPWIAEATVVVYNYARFDAHRFLSMLAQADVTSLCAPPTVWRMLIQADVGERPAALREAVSAGEPLNPEVIAHRHKRWGMTIRDGFGQTETTALIGNTPNASIKPGSMGRPLPGAEIDIIDVVSGSIADEGEICLRLDPRPVNLMTGYLGDGHAAADTTDGYYHTGDVASRDADGYITYVGRTDDVFKASDYKISPFELESVLIEHPAVAEAAVVPAPDPTRLAVPKAYVSLASGWPADRATADAIFAHARSRLAPYQRIRRIEFMELPKTISGKIRRVELRARENSWQPDISAGEFRDR
ncbi:MAG: acetyl-CoA synthetase [Mycobacterium sp.]|jgi:acetyl-CoA synthetase|nr:acetyl-CoA synthetase [Mycobacterium sp.]